MQLAVNRIQQSTLIILFRIRKLSDKIVQRSVERLVKLRELRVGTSGQIHRTQRGSIGQHVSKIFGTNDGRQSRRGGSQVGNRCRGSRISQRRTLDVIRQRRGERQQRTLGIINRLDARQVIRRTIHVIRGDSAKVQNR